MKIRLLKTIELGNWNISIDKGQFIRIELHIDLIIYLKLLFNVYF